MIVKVSSCKIEGELKNIAVQTMWPTVGAKWQMFYDENKDDSAGNIPYKRIFFSLCQLC